MSKATKKNIKEYVYLDDTEINSLLAQFKDGIPKVIQSVRQTGLSNTTSSTANYGKEAGLGFQFGAKGSLYAISF